MLTLEVEEDVEEAVLSVGKRVTWVETAPMLTRPPVVAALAGEVVSNVARTGIWAETVPTLIPREAVAGAAEVASRVARMAI